MVRSKPVKLEIQDLHVSVDGQEIIKGLDLVVRAGEVHALMGPNGSGKSTLSKALLGHPAYEITKGQVRFKGQNVLELTPDQRARLGLFLAFQYPVEIPGVSIANFLRTAVNARRGQEVPVAEFYQLMVDKMAFLKIDESFADRYLNEGFSGGEKKRNEVLQMALLEPEMAILDETDSGLDIDALRVVCDGINKMRGPNLGMLIITHYQRMLNYVEPDFVHVLYKGRMVRSGDKELALELEKRGYDWVRAEVDQSPASEGRML